MIRYSLHALPFLLLFLGACLPAAPAEPEGSARHKRDRLEALNELDDRLEAISSLTTGDFSPYWRTRCTGDEQRADLDQVQFFVDGVQALVDRAKAQGVFDGPRGPAPRLGMSEWQQRPRARVHRAPHLGSWRHWTNLLCSAALSSADRAPEGLALALDLAHLIDEGTLIHGMTRIAVEGVVLQAIAELLEQGPRTGVNCEPRSNPALSAPPERHSHFTALRVSQASSMHTLRPFFAGNCQARPRSTSKPWG